MADLQPPPTYAEVILVDEITGRPKFNPVWLGWFLELTAVLNVAGGTVLDHSLLAGLQGGAVTDYYHLTGAQHTDLTDGGTTTLHTHVTGIANVVTLVDAGADTTTWVVLGTAQTGNVSPATDAGLTYDASTNALTATTFIGALTGNATTATNVAVGGITGLGTGVATALAVNVGSAGSPVVNGGALGTPSSGTVTNLTGTASININGTVGATTPAAGTFTTLAISAGAVISGTYTPTRSAEANLDGNVTMSQAQYMRVGATVTVSGAFTADPTLTATATSFEITLPVASNIGAVEDAAGIAFCGAIAGMGAQVIGVVANDTAKVSWVSTDVTSQTWSYTFTYRVI